jgi:Xaa-Pro aminopeptidase
MFDLTEATQRWARTRRMMAEQNLDALLAIDLSRDEILLANQRWLTGYIPIGGPAAVLLHRDGHIELISERIGMPVTEYLKAHAFPIQLVNGYSATLIAERIARLAPQRLGVAEPECFSAALAAILCAQPTRPELVDASGLLQRLRLRKSSYELGLIRTSCAIADSVWEQMPDLFKVGRRYFEIVADVDHLVRLSGAEGGFHLLLPLPFLGRPMQSLANEERITPESRYLMEVSPRFNGYYSQLTIPVTTFSGDSAAQRAYEDVVEAKAFAQPLMRPGTPLRNVAESIAEFLGKRGRAMTSLSLGHFCGMALEEPRDDPDASLTLEEDMTIIFHPVLADRDFRSLMRADTYLITAAGAEQLNRYRGGMLVV